MPLIRKNAGTPPAAAAPPDVDADLARLRRGSPDERWDAARRLAAAPQAAAALGAALAAEPDARVREAIFTSLARLDSSAAAEAAIACIRSDDAQLRTGAMDALQAMPTALGPQLAALLRDADPDVRLLACELVRSRPEAEATALLSRLLDSEPEINVVAAAVDVLAEIGGREAVPALRRCGARFAGQPFLDFAVRDACERLERQSAPPHG